jgi:hypothetical protein
MVNCFQGNTTSNVPVLADDIGIFNAESNGIVGNFRYQGL